MFSHNIDFILQLFPDRPPANGSQAVNLTNDTIMTCGEKVLISCFMGEVEVFFDRESVGARDFFLAVSIITDIAL